MECFGTFFDLKWYSGKKRVAMELNNYFTKLEFCYLAKIVNDVGFILISNSLFQHFNQ